MITAQASLVQIGSEAAVEELMADQGHHDNRLLAQCAQWQVRIYIPEKKQKTRRWTDRPKAYAAAFRANRRRVRGEKGKRLNRWRSKQCERPFAHVCETGGGRRSWRRGTDNVAKAHLMRCAAHNLALLLRKCFGLGRTDGSGGLRPPDPSDPISKKHPPSLSPSPDPDPSALQKTTPSLTGW